MEDGRTAVQVETPFCESHAVAMAVPILVPMPESLTLAAAPRPTRANLVVCLFVVCYRIKNRET